MRALVLLCVVALFAPGVSLAKRSMPMEDRSFLQGVRIDPSDPRRESYYGWSVSASGNSVLLGMPYELTGTTLTAGAAYVQRFNGSQWIQEAKLAPSDGVSFDYFGEAVSLFGDLAAIGAPDHQSARGAVYVFERSGSSWTQIAKLLPLDPQPNARFGAAISFDGATLAIAAPGYNGGRGTVYLFGQSGGNWSQTNRLQSSDIAANDRFGQALAIDGETLLVGSPGKNLTANSQGAAYVFSRTGSQWSQQTRWTRQGAQAGESFGSAVAIDGDLAVSSAPFAPGLAGSGGGVVETFVRENGAWASAGSLRTLTGSQSAQFGFSLSLRGQRLLIGLAGDTVGDSILQGSVETMLFEAGTWTLGQRLLSADGEQEAQLGYAVALATDFAVAGAPGASNGAASYAGTAYAFENRATAITLFDVPAQPVRLGESYSASVSLSASASPVTGTVSIVDDRGNTCTAALVAGSGSCTLTATAVGPRSLRARYNGAPGFAESFGEAGLQVRPDLRLQPASLPEGQIGAAYSQIVDTPATGATLPLSYSIASGQLPQGLSLGGNGRLSGTPSEFGNFNFSVQVRDSSSAALGGPFSESRVYSLRIQPPFRTALVLDPVASPRDRGVTVAFGAQLDVIETGAGAPAGTFAVSAANGASTLSCSTPVVAEGPQSCSIEFGPGAAVGDYVVSAAFTSTNADFGSSSDSDALRLLSPSDPSLALSALDPLYLAGDSLRFRVEVQNPGPDVALALRVQAPAPAGLQNLSWSCSGAACPAASGSGAPDLQIAALAAGASLQIELVGGLTAPLPVQIDASASLSLDPAGFGRDLDPGNNSASARSLPLKLFANSFETPEN